MARVKTALVTLAHRESIPSWVIGAYGGFQDRFLPPWSDSVKFGEWYVPPPLWCFHMPLPKRNRLGGLSALHTRKFIIATNGRLYAMADAIDDQCAVDELNREISLLPALWKWGLEISIQQDQEMQYLGNLLSFHRELTVEDRSKFFGKGVIRFVESYLKKFDAIGAPYPIFDDAISIDAICGESGALARAYQAAEWERKTSPAARREMEIRDAGERRARKWAMRDRRITMRKQKEAAVALLNAEGLL